MKKAHLLRCACPARSNVPPGVRLRSPVFARLASKTFLIGLMRLLIEDVKAKNLSPAALIDVHYLNELEQSGFVKNLYGE
jgi:hypothetical protein